jgi:two-component system sensor histidine kinase PhoQ
MAAALVLLAVQGAILRWGLAPLRQVAREINEIESGRRAQLEATYPRELRSLTTNLNALIESSNRHLKRYRNALEDLAHSLKTPLAVMQSTIETEASIEELRGTFSKQLERLRRTVEYQLQRAVASGRTALMAPISVQSVAEKLVESFQKVYAETPRSFELWLDGAVQFYGDEGDLMEILGNLIDNACKCSRQRVRISGYVMPERSARRSAVVLAVEDDGPGIPVEERAAVLERGVRGESGSAGQGIGLAVVRDLVVDVYGGSLNFETSSLGGARVEAMIQF